MVGGKDGASVWRRSRPSFIRPKVDVILAAGTAPALASKQATAVIPVVFGLAGDPLGTGLVASLARPGGNITGLSNEAADLASKRLGILRELLPGFRRLATLAYADYPGRKQETDEVQEPARTLGLEMATFEIRRAEDIAAVIDRLADPSSSGQAISAVTTTKEVLHTNEPY